MFILAWTPDKNPHYASDETHFITFKGVWINAEGFPNYGSAVDAMELFEQGRR